MSVVDVAGLVALGRVAIHTGDVGLMVQTGKLAQPILRASEPGLQHHAAWLLALQLMANSDPDGAHATLTHVAPGEGDTVMALYPLDVTDPPQLVRIAVAAGDTAMATVATDVAEERSRANPQVAALEGIAAHAHGLLHADVGELEVAVDFLRHSARPLAMTSAVEDLGRLALAAGDRQKAVDSFHQALRAYSELGATWDGARVRGRLRGLGVRTRLPPPKKTQSAWAGLTESELAVVRLVARGLTNREVADRLFVSPHTVGQHLRHVFSKLDINSRVELARLAASALP
jgi:DNA-binding CsgD family transcriptional regulator